MKYLSKFPRVSKREINGKFSMPARFERVVERLQSLSGASIGICVIF